MALETRILSNDGDETLPKAELMLNNEGQETPADTKRAIWRIAYFYLVMCPLLAGFYLIHPFHDVLLFNVMVPACIFGSDRDRWLVSTRKLRWTSFVCVEIGSVALTSLMVMVGMKSSEFSSQLLTSTLIVVLVIWVVLQPIGSRAFGFPKRKRRA